MKREHKKNPTSQMLSTDGLTLELEIEEMEPIQAPALVSNSSETMVADDRDER
jgi:hypothetical protein